MAQDFKLVSDFVDIARRSMELEDTTILDPTSANPLIMGEWLEMSSTIYGVKRGTVNPSTVPSWAVFAEQGRFETQVLGKVPILFMKPFEADTKIMLATGLAVGDALEVADVTIGSLTRRGLVKFTTGFKVGRVTRLPADNGGYLRFLTMNA
jgi:hypothetical protein